MVHSKKTTESERYIALCRQLEEALAENERLRNQLEGRDDDDPLIQRNQKLKNELAKTLKELRVVGPIADEHTKHCKVPEHSEEQSTSRQVKFKDTPDSDRLAELTRQLEEALEENERLRKELEGFDDNDALKRQNQRLEEELNKALLEMREMRPIVEEHTRNISKKDDAPDEDNTPLDNEDEAVDPVNDVAGSSYNNREDTEHLTGNKGGSPVGIRRKFEKIVHVEQRTDEDYRFQKQVATKPKNQKGEIQQFCNLLYTKLEALDERKRDFVMHEINNLMFNAKNNPSFLPNAMPDHKQPKNSTNSPKVGITPNKNLQSLLSPVPLLTSSTSSSSQESETM